jgi:hypothetical protein
MDRRFLSQAAVIESSRQFVCVRLLTYESAEEAKFLKALFVGRSGDLENTLFAILSPDGKRVLAKAGRSPSHDFADARELADTMHRVARPFAERKRPEELPLPSLATVRLALDVAACDNQPLVVVLAEDPQVRKRLETTLAALAWSDAHIGQFVYATATAAKELAAVKGWEGRPALLVIQPDRFGLTGSVLAQADADASKAQVAALLKKGAAQYQRLDKTFSTHVRDGQRQGVFWETVLPVTDPWERDARERGRSRDRP